MSACVQCLSSPCECTVTTMITPRLTVVNRRPAPPAPAPAPMQLDEAFCRSYELKDRLAAGGMGAVYRARQLSTGRDVAIKFLLHADSPAQVRRFQIETRALVALQHPHVLSILDAGVVAGRPFLVTELLGGGTLRARMTPGERADLEHACEIVAQVLAGLASCHRRGILHRDLKPDNILFDSTGHVKIADLGLAKQGDDEITTAGEILGTPLYMSPEQLAGEHATPASDLFAVGLIFYELLFGALPLCGQTLAELIGQRRNGRLSLPHQGLPPHVALLLYRLLAIEPAERPCSAAEALRMLTANRSPASSSAAVRQLTSGSFARTSGSFARSADSAVRPWLAGLVAGVAGLVLGWYGHAGASGLTAGAALPDSNMSREFVCQATQGTPHALLERDGRVVRGTTRAPGRRTP